MSSLRWLDTAHRRARQITSTAAPVQIPTIAAEFDHEPKTAAIPSQMTGCCQMHAITINIRASIHFIFTKEAFSRVEN
jgi:hypothetical protein